MSQVAIVIHRHPTAIHRHLIRIDGGERLLAACQGAVEGEAHNSDVEYNGEREKERVINYLIPPLPCWK